MNFQNIILALQNFWADYGCLIWQPYYTQVGAGTMNPATSLRVLGPEPWKVAYVEPSIRPDDGRYGENPNRMQMHYQFQVILKPDPGDPQEVYLRSLQAVGIDPQLHDIRFVEDNWESPALGAWGLGWEVWLDGQEITQFTYFQQSGGIALDPVSVEITYGLERIAIALQGVDSFRNIQWSPALTDGDVNLQAEQEHSKYYFEIADVDRLRQMYELFEGEARACLSQGMVLPAHDYILKCSHTFNMLDTRGAVGVTERQALFGRMRELSRQVAEAYVEQRRVLGFPFLKSHVISNQKPVTSQDEISEKGQPSASMQEETSESTAPAPFLLEIGTEELPAGDLDEALRQLEASLPGWLKDLRLGHGEVQVMGTPRRLVVFIHDLQPRQPDLEQLVKGPPADRAYDPSGKPTPAAAGFARSKGLSVDELVVKEIDGGSYAAAVIRKVGRPAVEVLGEALPGWIAALRFDKSMRWNQSGVTFARPVRWLLCIYGEGDSCRVVPFEYAGLCSGNLTRGLRFRQPESQAVHSHEDYLAYLHGQGIQLEVRKRREEIQKQVQQLAAEAGGQVQFEADLLAEVANLVEAPVAFCGSFEGTYLNLPQEVLVSVMKKHQRYFPVAVRPAAGGQSTGELLPFFIAVRNGGGEEMPLVTEGNEHVIRARFADADYFVREDIKRPLEAYLPRLSTLTFQVQMGSMLDKSRRIAALVEELAPMLGMDQVELNTARRAAELCKADLATQMVVEMTSLQGQMGRVYALRSGEPEAVAQAIFEHYLPRFSGDGNPASLPGLAVGVADRLDSLAGLFAAGLAPSGNKDPFALRRTALGLVQNLVTWDLDFDLQASLEMTTAHLPLPATPETLQTVIDFTIERLRNALLDGGQRFDAIEAVLSAQGSNPAGAAREVKALEAWIAQGDWREILPAYARCVRITRDLQETYPTDRRLAVEPAEADLFGAVAAAEAVARRPGSVDDFLQAFLPTIPQVSRFFDEVLVMVDQLEIRRNRLGLLQRIAGLAKGVADISKLEGF